MAKFSGGALVATPNALVQIDAVHGDMGWAFQARIMGRHLSGDWGTMCDEDKAENELALVEGSRLMSTYLIDEKNNAGPSIWVITEADRSSTTILMPEDY